jgi:hypothetical protein
MASGWCDTCFCFRDIRRAIVAIGMFSGGCSGTQILIAVAVFTGMFDMIKLSPDSKEVTTYQLYIALACFDFVLLVFSFCLIYGNERTDEMLSRNYLLPWAIFVPFYVVFETGVNIYYFYYQFNNKYMDPLKEGSMMGFVIVPLVYWIIKDIILFISFMFVVIRVQYLQPQVKYVRQIEPCHECTYSPPAPPMIALPQAPTIPRPVPPRCTSCSGGSCNADRCRNAPQPMYGYAGFNTGAGFSGGGAGKTGGWTTSIYNTGF